MASRRDFLRAAGAGAAVAVAGCFEGDSPDSTAGEAGDATAWPMVGGDRQHTRYIPGGNAPREGVTETWRVETGMFTAEPIVAGDTVLATVGDDVLAVDAATGERRWSLDPEETGAAYWGAPAVSEETAFVAGRELVRAVDLADGDVEWTYELAHPSTAATVVGHEGRGVFVAAGETVARLDPETGEPDWETELFGQIRAAPAVRPPLLVVATEGGDVYALEAGTGQGLWRTGLPDSVRTTPSMADRRIYVGCFDGKLYALGHRGQVVWSTAIGGFAKGGIAVADGTVYADGGREIHAVSTDGSKEWSIDVGTTGDHPPTVVDDTVYTGGDRLRALKPGGGVGFGDRRIEPARFTAELGERVGLVTAADGSLYATVRVPDGESTRGALLRLDDP